MAENASHRLRWLSIRSLGGGIVWADLGGEFRRNSVTGSSFEVSELYSIPSVLSVSCLLQPPWLMFAASCMHLSHHDDSSFLSLQMHNPNKLFFLYLALSGVLSNRKVTQLYVKAEKLAKSRCSLGFKCPVQSIKSLLNAS